jgi:HEAT repeat protein
MLNLPAFIMCTALLIGCVQAREPTPELLRDLQSGSTETRKAAAWELADRIDPISAALSRTAIQDPDKSVRGSAIMALSRRGQIVRPTIEKALKDPDPCVQRIAMCVLRILDARDSSSDNSICDSLFDADCMEHPDRRK